MTDKEIYNFLLADEVVGTLTIEDDNKDVFELDPLGIIPLHGVVYAVLDLLKINHKEVSEEESGLVIFELDYDEETDEYFVETVEDDDVFNEVYEAFDALPIE